MRPGGARRPSGPTDWRAIDRFLVQERGLRPWELDSLTMSEVALYCEKADSTGPDGGPAIPSDEELMEYAQWWASLTPRERLEQAR